jgi:dTDP-4-amino-4,6-dideoxygalactose transaminase
MNYFSHARTSLKTALNLYLKQKEKKILIPYYVCDALLQPIRQLGFSFIFYEINNDLTPNWNQLETLTLQHNCWSIIMIHFFGQPQNIELFEEFCKTHNLILIEDNAHGFGGTYNNKFLGTFGDIGIASPRKIFNTTTGGILYLNGKIVQPNNNTNRSLFLIELLRSIIFFSSKFHYYLIEILGRKPKFNSPFETLEPEIKEIKSADFLSSVKINKNQQQIEKISFIRRNNWKYYQNLTRKLNISLVYDEVNPQSCPWAFPFYVNSKFEKDLTINFLRDKKINVYPWPYLPIELKDNIKVNKIWDNLLCIPIYNEEL